MIKGMAVSADMSSPEKSLFPEKAVEPFLSRISDRPSVLRSIDLTGPAGRLEALLNEGDANAPYSVLVCHPHPLGGGTMHNKVVYHAMKVFQDFGWPVLRFNFRGTGRSEGRHDGSAEAEDVRAGLEWLSARYNNPMIAAGFSFGAAMGLKACSSYSQGPGDLRGFVALGLPTHAEGRDYAYPFLSDCRFPKLFLSGDHDQYAPANHLRGIAESAPDPKELILIEGADHFFRGQLQTMQAALDRWLRKTFLISESVIR
jgi:uncharacterized protein